MNGDPARSSAAARFFGLTNLLMSRTGGNPAIARMLIFQDDAIAACSF